MSDIIATGTKQLVRHTTRRMRFPVLFGLCALVFLADLFIPDVIPFVDEIFLGLMTALMGLWKERRKGRAPSGLAQDHSEH